ncbi:FCSD flavin-binding domain-containing protein [Bradyrhizobium lablabi]|uniref:FCSD flavin-binding domain-containing protein n=1 Tax=Bradyrhizobium lablabi TaxID=722472 RepID=UPI001BAB0BF6|nr:FCSD flavin-binding domain-containing protein [Bradyrhizobium lablabi]MBR0694390.1 FCSD flavin-binding domain-containing protein [Bradyrhizobium lablabi]
MTVTRRPTRRDVVRGVAVIAAALPQPSFAQASPRVAVIGGGFGGAACARALRRLDPKLQVTLIEPNRTFVACPFSNEVIAGLRELSEQQFGYDRIAADGVAVVAQAAAKVDAHARTIGLADGSTLPYDRLVLSPGIDMRFDAMPGYDEAASAKMPHAWKAGEQTALLRRQIEAMNDGGLVVIAVPAAPLRCPPAPYERAGLIAHYLKTKKPRSKILILDAKDNYSQQKLFENAWQELYPGMIERVALSQGGRVTSVNPATNEIVTDFGNYTADVANVIPPQRAGHIAAIAGAADHTGWCPIDPVTFASKLVPDIHVIGDACIAGGIPKSASAAGAQGEACAAAIVNAFAGKPPDTPRLNGACYNTVAPGYAFSLRGIYQPRDDQYAEAEVTTSPVEATREVRRREAEQALDWFQTITVNTFG